MSVRADVEHRDVDVGDGLRLHVAIAGEGGGPPLVLLHGFTGSAEAWAPVWPQLGARCTTIAVDLPGHGRSSAPDDARRYALPRFADDLEHVLETLGLERVAVLGYSMGGRAALHFALRHPGSVAALLLESTSPGIADDGERRERAAADVALAAAIERDGIDAFVERWEALPLWTSQHALSDSERARLRAQRRENRPRGLANSLRGAGAATEPSLASRLSTLAIPALLVAGALDTKYVAIGRELERLLPSARLAIVPDAGHAVHLERPAELVAVATGFLRGIAYLD
jgi:2-succinyl-6-hydroxy-2,4-cyclohexadiene-1-carboxylate synthase